MLVVQGKSKISYKKRNQRDGTGPYKGSAQASISKKGEKKEAGKECPFDELEEKAAIDFREAHLKLKHH